MNKTIVEVAHWRPTIHFLHHKIQQVQTKTKAQGRQRELYGVPRQWTQHRRKPVGFCSF